MSVSVTSMQTRRYPDCLVVTGTNLEFLGSQYSHVLSVVTKSDQSDPRTDWRHLDFHSERLI